jgi:hypothetical protein
MLSHAFLLFCLWNTRNFEVEPDPKLFYLTSFFNIFMQDHTVYGEFIGVQKRSGDQYHTLIIK